MSLPNFSFFSIFDDGFGALFGSNMFTRNVSSIPTESLFAKCMEDHTFKTKAIQVMARMSEDEEDRSYAKVQAAIEEARIRLENGGGLGNQDADLLAGVEAGVEAAKTAGELTQSVDTFMSTLDDLGRSTETLMP